MGFARATRDTYIPRFAESVTLMTGLRGSADAFDESGRLIVPKDAMITLFPSYTRKVGDEYLVDVRGWLWCPGLMTRKNRLILSLAKQLTRSTNLARQDQVVGKLEDERLSQDVYNPDDSSELSSIDSDLTSISTAESRRDTTAELQSLASNAGSDALLRQRMGSFIARSLPGIEIRVIVGSIEALPTNSLEHAMLTTDVNGHFEGTVRVKYEPAVIQVQPLQNETIFSMQDVIVYPNHGMAIISDIDDTIKLTGVCGDKRDLMRKLLVSDIQSWNIPSIVAWYRDYSQKHSVSFHYVSNSPWQLYSVIHEYFKAVDLPSGSVHLKQYSGNILTNLMEPSSSRKKKSLYKILEDFPNKSFICVGDSGEQDLEAYVDLATKYPSRVKAIFIRYVTNSLSDVDDMKIMRRLTRIQATAESRLEKLSEGVENLIDLESDPSPEDRAAKLPPMRPKKPDELKGKKLGRKPPPDMPVSSACPAPLRAHTDSELAMEKPPPLPRRLNTIDDDQPWRPPPKLLLDLQTIYHFHDFEELEDLDSKGAAWIKRLIGAITRLEGTGTRIKIFTDEDEEFFKTSLEIARKQVEP